MSTKLETINPTKTILLIDDDSEDAGLFRYALMEVDPATSFIHVDDALEGLGLLARMQLAPDYIFLDLNMPRMNGNECLIRLRQDPRLAGTPIIIFTTSRDPSDMHTARQNGANAFISKPINFKDLVGVISFALEGTHTPGTYIANHVQVF